MQLCPCGSNKSFNECCELYISGKQTASTPEILMRSRYTAYTQANVDYIQATMKGEVAKDFNAEISKLWSQQAKWLKLEVLTATTVSANDKVGFVEFVAHYIFNNKKEIIHELSEFQYENGQWYYIDGQPGKAITTSFQEGKIGRNDTCPCGSNKKYKKCCVK